VVDPARQKPLTGHEMTERSAPGASATAFDQVSAARPGGVAEVLVDEDE
jgi:hypothetical protein